MTRYFQIQKRKYVDNFFVILIICVCFGETILIHEGAVPVLVLKWSHISWIKNKSRKRALHCPFLSEMQRDKTVLCLLFWVVIFYNLVSIVCGFKSHRGNSILKWVCWSQSFRVLRISWNYLVSYFFEMERIHYFVPESRPSFNYRLWLI